MSVFEKKLVSRVITSYVDVERSLDDVVELMERYKKQYSENYTNLRLDTYCDRYDGTYSVCLKGDQLENDLEYEERILKEKIEIEFRKKRDMDKLARLQKLYGEKQ